MVATALARDRELAFGSSSTQGRLAPLLAVLDEHVHEPPGGDVATSKGHAVDLGAGTAVYTTAFAEHFPWLLWTAASPKEDAESSAESPIGIIQTQEALKVMCDECEPAEVSAGKRLCFISEGPCAVREGDVVRLRGLQQRHDLNGQLGTVLCGTSCDQQPVTEPPIARVPVQLEGSSTKLSLKPINLVYERPGCVDASVRAGREFRRPCPFCSRPMVPSLAADGWTRALGARRAFGRRRRSGRRPRSRGCAPSCVA